MAAEVCRDCLLCLARIGTTAKAAPCERLLGLGAESVYVELVRPACRHVVPRSARGPWTDEQLRTLLDCASRMAAATGHDLGECVDELRRMAKSEARRLVWDKGA